MTYDYTCPNCHRDCERVVPVDDRDNQLCPNCGARLKRHQVPAKLSIVIPAAFSTTTARHHLAQPQTAEERRAWDEQGVRAFKDSDF